MCVKVRLVCFSFVPKLRKHFSSFKPSLNSKYESLKQKICIRNTRNVVGSQDGLFVARQSSAVGRLSSVVWELRIDICR